MMMSDATVPSSADDWLSARDAARLLNVHPRTLTKLGDRRLISRRSVGGLPPRYLRSDCERLLADAITPAIGASVALK